MGLTGCGIKDAKLIWAPKATVPESAGATHPYGEVRFAAVVNKHGTVESLHLISGDESLVTVSRDAAKRYRYRPATARGIPTESTQLITIQFETAQEAQGNAGTDLRSLLLQFRNTRGLAGKERILNRITQQAPESGRQLLQVAQTTGDNDTLWMSIRGLGMLKYRPAIPFLLRSLDSPEPYVRANSARALYELRYQPAKVALIRLLESEQDPGVIGQASLALRMMKARESVPVLKSRMAIDSIQSRCWILDAIAELGSTADVPFMATYLYNSDSSLPLCAARAISAITGEDFGLPKREGIFDPVSPVLTARKWWDATREGYRPK